VGGGCTRSEINKRKPKPVTKGPKEEEKNTWCAKQGKYSKHRRGENNKNKGKRGTGMVCGKRYNGREGITQRSIEKGKSAMLVKGKGFSLSR